MKKGTTLHRLNCSSLQRPYSQCPSLSIPFPSSQYRPRTIHSGFTLIEMLVSIVITGMILTMVGIIFTSTMKTRQNVQNNINRVATGPAILQMMKQDFSTTLSFPERTSSQSFFRGTDHQIAGQPANTVDFVTTTSSWDKEHQQFISLAECGYLIKPHPDKNNRLRLFRRHDTWINGNPTRGGSLVLLSDRIISFKLEFKKMTLPGKNNKQHSEKLGKWLDTWNDTQQPFRQMTPDLIRVTLKMEVSNPEDQSDARKDTYQSIFRIY